MQSLAVMNTEKRRGRERESGNRFPIETVTAIWSEVAGLREVQNREGEQNWAVPYTKIILCFPQTKRAGF